MYLFTILSILLPLADVSSAQESPEVVTLHGTITGRAGPTPLGVNVESFKGIPFGLPPVGSRRFANPEPYGDYPGGVWSADEYGFSCVQVLNEDFAPNIAPTSEDCLYLNIWRPQTVKANRAVMVWIHGGAFSIRSGSQSYYNGQVLSVFGDVIVVSMNYRLNTFGFFHTGDERMPNGNQGLLDQQLALQWVQENIEAFGGDPRQVTIFGESAGSTSVNSLMLMPGSESLFNRAIMQSGDSTAYWGSQSMDTVAIFADWVANETGCINDDTLLDCLRDIPAEELLSTTVSGTLVDPLYSPDTPVVDGVTIPDKPLNMLEAGQFQKKDVLMGFNKDEGSLYVFTFPGVTPETVEEDPNGTVASVLENHLGPLMNLTQEEMDAVYQAYFTNGENEFDKAKICISDMIGDVTFACSTEQAARAFDSYGVKVFQYYLTYRPNRSPYDDWQGVVHGDDIQWVFGAPFYQHFDYDETEDQLAIDHVKMGRFCKIRISRFGLASLFKCRWSCLR